MGEMQPWYKLMRAARYLGVAPWELAIQPLYWLNHALAAESIDDAVEVEMAKRFARKRSK